MIPTDWPDTLPATTVRRRFTELLKQLGSERSAITITRNGVPAGVLMSVEESQGLIETLEILADPTVLSHLGRARRNFARRRTRTREQVWRGA